MARVLSLCPPGDGAPGVVGLDDGTVAVFHEGEPAPRVRTRGDAEARTREDARVQALAARLRAETGAYATFGPPVFSTDMVAVGRDGEGRITAVDGRGWLFRFSPEVPGRLVDYARLGLDAGAIRYTSPAGLAAERVCVGHGDGALACHALDGEPVWRVQGHGAGVAWVRAHGDGWVSAGLDGTVRGTRGDGSESFRAEADGARGLVSDGRRLWVAGRRGPLAVLEALTGARAGGLDVGVEQPVALALDAARGRLAVAGLDGAVVWATTEGAPLGRFAVRRAPRALAFARDGALLVGGDGALFAVATAPPDAPRSILWLGDLILQPSPPERRPPARVAPRTDEALARTLLDGAGPARRVPRPLVRPCPVLAADGSERPRLALLDEGSAPAEWLGDGTTDLAGYFDTLLCAEYEQAFPLALDDAGRLPLEAPLWLVARREPDSTGPEDLHTLLAARREGDELLLVGTCVPCDDPHTEPEGELLADTFAVRVPFEAFARAVARALAR